MAKVLTFSRVFPAYHPKAGQKTFFVEKILSSLSMQGYAVHPFPQELEGYVPKHHTIREGSRWKVGDKFSPRFWSGKPYNSKQIIIAPDIEVKKVWRFEMIPALWADECEFVLTLNDGNELMLTKQGIIEIASNDGLLLSDFIYWFAGKNMVSSLRKPFKGQIICWNEQITY